MRNGDSPENTAASGSVPAAPTAFLRLTTRLIHGSLWSAAGQGTFAVASLIATPFVIRGLGNEGYGVLALVNAVIGYLGIADIGMGAASTKLGAEAHARGDDDGESAAVWTSLLVASVPAMLAMIVLGVTAEPLVRQVLRVPSHLQGPTVVALRLAAIGFLFRNVVAVVNTPQLVRLRLASYTLINSGCSVAQVCLVPAVVASGGGLVGAAAVMAGASATSAALNAIASWRLLPRLVRPRLKRDLLLPVARFCGPVMFCSFAGAALLNAEKVLLARFGSVTALAYYAVALNVAQVLTIVAGAVKPGLLPAFTRLQESGEQKRLQQLYGRALRGSLLWVVPAALVMCAGAKPFLSVWAGPTYGRESTIPFYLLVVGTVGHVMAHPPYELLKAYGRTDLIACFFFVELGPYLLAISLLAWKWGAAGAALAWSLRAIGDACLFFLAAHRLSGCAFIPIRDNHRSYAVAVMLLLLPVLLVGMGDWPLALRIGTTAASLLAYCSLIWLRVLTAEERAWLNQNTRRRGAIS
jgi:O-antigen/teichoic acid export membrane protein